MNNLEDGFVVIPIIFNVVKRSMTCSKDIKHRNGLFFVRDSVEISLGCADCLTSQEFTSRLFQEAGISFNKPLFS